MGIFNLYHSIETIKADCFSCGERGENHETIIRVQKIHDVIIMHFNAGLKDETYLDPITTPEGVQYRFKEKKKITNAGHWRTKVKELFLYGSSQTQQCSGQRVKSEQVYIAVWTADEVQRSSDSSENNPGFPSTSSSISSSWRGAGSESGENVLHFQ